MAKIKTIYACTQCGAQSPKWVGQCPECGAWNSLQEEQVAATPARNRGGYAGETALRMLADVDAIEEMRTHTGFAELDRVLGGGMVQGGVTLIGGDPGIGKSTLLLQMLARLEGRLKRLYVAGEESLQQIGLRAQRLGLPPMQMAMLAETSVERIIEVLRQHQPQLVVIDSIQTMYTEALQSAPGSVAQVRESTAQLVRYAKQHGTAIFLVGHVTKEGAIAGPRVLEHMVDTVLYFESDIGGRFRVIRAVKNRFGAVNELGIFAMTEAGLKEVAQPSAIFLSRHEEAMDGSTITCIREGSRPLLLEIQALADDSHLNMPRRLAVGIDGNRLALLLAVLHRHGGLATSNKDVFVNVVGGMRISETAADLPVILAIVSSYREQALPTDMVVFGELGLAGEIRPVPNGEDRLREAAKHGFRLAIVPQGNAPRSMAIAGMEVLAVRHLRELMTLLDERFSPQ